MLPLLIFVSQVIHAQQSCNTTVSINFPQISLCDIEPNRNSINLSLTTPVEAGLPLTSSSVNNSKWLNYTCAVAGSSTNAITVQSNSNISGLNLQVTASAYTGIGAGTNGISNGVQPISTTARSVVSGIRNCYTGNGAGNGHQLNYSLGIGNHSTLHSTSYSITIIYTMISQ